MPPQAKSPLVMKSTREDSWLETTTDTAAIAAARALAEKNVDAKLRKLLVTPEKSRYDDIDRTVQRNRGVLIPAWRKLVNDTSAPRERRITAAEFLCKQHDDGAFDFLFREIASTKKESRREALVVIYTAVCNHTSWMQRYVNRLRPVLLNLFVQTNDDSIPMLALMCVKLKIAGAHAKARALWNEEFSPHARHALADLLAPGGKTAERFRVVADEFTRVELSEFHRSQLLQCATAFLDSPETRVVQGALDLIDKHFPWTLKEMLDDGYGANYEWVPIIEETGTRGGRAALPLLEKFYRSRLNTGYRGFALLALTAALGKESLPYIDEALDNKRLRSAAAQALGKAFQGTGDEKVIDRLQKLLAKTRDEYVHYRITEALTAIGGAEARKTAKKQLKSAPPINRQHLNALAKPRTLTHVLDRLVELGVIPHLSKAEISDMRARENRSDDDAGWSLLILDYAKSRVGFDTETGEVPCRHDYLIQEFADASRGLFRPEAISQSKPKKNGECTVQFVFGDRLYRFASRDFGDYYDVDRVVDAINQALADAGHVEQFVGHDTGDQTADFLFGDPAALAKAAKEFAWCLEN